MGRKMLFIIPAGIVGIVLLMALGGGVVRQLWNWLLPPLFGWHRITFWQALGLLALSRILFGGLGAHGFRRSHGPSHEQRERFRHRMREKFGAGPAAGESGGGEPGSIG